MVESEILGVGILQQYLDVYPIVQVSIHLDQKSVTFWTGKSLQRIELKLSRVKKKKSRRKITNGKVFVETQERELELEMNSIVYVFHRVDSYVDELHACDLPIAT